MKKAVKIMSSVTSRVKEVKQPRGGYIKPSAFVETKRHDDFVLNENENVHSAIIGMAVDYLTRFMLNGDVRKAFAVSIKGFLTADEYGVPMAEHTGERLISCITGLDDESIRCACKLVAFDVWYRNPNDAVRSKQSDEIEPDAATIENVRILVKRSLSFFEDYGPVVADEFSFCPETPNAMKYAEMLKTGKGMYGGYTSTVSTGDGDFLTADTMWDFKVSKSKPTSKHTLQLLMYWIMGQYSGQSVYEGIINVGIFNPRLNAVYTLDMSTVPDGVIGAVERDVICYERMV